MDHDNFYIHIAAFLIVIMLILLFEYIALEFVQDIFVFIGGVTVARTVDQWINHRWPIGK